MDAIEEQAEKYGLSPNKMLDRMVDEWIAASLSGKRVTPEPAPPAEEPERKARRDKPWFLP